MIYLRYTLIDSDTGLPVSEVNPALSGPKHPEGIKELFTEFTQLSSVPEIYGECTDEQYIMSWMERIDENNLVFYFREHLLKTVLEFRKQGCRGNIVVDGLGIFSFDHKKDLLDLLQAMEIDESLCKVDFKAYSWVELNKFDIKTIIQKLNMRIQTLFSWQRQMESIINDCKTIEDCFKAKTLMKSSSLG